MKIIINSAIFLLGLTVMMGCVSKSAYNKVVDENTSLGALTSKQKLELESQKNELYETKHRLVEQSSLIDGLQTRMGKSALHKAELDRSLAETRQALTEMQKRKAEMESELTQFKDLTLGLQSMIDTGSVKVTFVKGRMVVSLGADVLFRSGSARLSSDGVEAVAEVAKQLAKISGKDFQVEGHTDNLPIKTKEFPTNWQLAAARAYSVLTTMQAAGMPAERVSMASYSDTRPTAENDTAENRALNRRIDIVVLPDLSKLMDVETIAKRTSTPTRALGSQTTSPAATRSTEEGTEASEE